MCPLTIPTDVISITDGQIFLSGDSWTHLCNGGSAGIVAHVVVEVEGFQAAGVCQELLDGSTGMHRAADVLERQPLQSFLQRQGGPEFESC